MCVCVLFVIGFVAGNYARVMSGPHKDLQGKVRALSTSIVLYHNTVLPEEHLFIFGMID